MEWLSHWFGGGSARRKAATRLHDAIVGQARRPEFYETGLAEDTLEGRFDLAVIHAAIVMRRLRELGPGGKALAKALFRQLFSGFDHALRETGTGDLRVGRKMRALGELYYGQARAIDEAMASENARAHMSDVFFRNAPMRGEEGAMRLADYVVEGAGSMAELTLEAFMEGQVAFPEPPPLTA